MFLQLESYKYVYIEVFSNNLLNIERVEIVIKLLRVPLFINWTYNASFKTFGNVPEDINAL